MYCMKQPTIAPLKKGNTMKKTTLSLALAGAFALAMVVDASVISVNFAESAGHANQQMGAATTAGLAGYVHDNWNNTAGASGTLGSLVDTDGATTTASVTWNSAGVWGDADANTDATAGVGDAQLARGYLDDGNPGNQVATWTVTGIGYANYDVVLYLSTDTNGDTYLPFDVNGTSNSVTASPKSQYTSPNWDGSNTIIISGLTGDLTVTGLNRDGGNRGSVGGFQIVQVPEPATLGMVALFGGGILFIRRRMSYWS